MLLVRKPVIMLYFVIIRRTREGYKQKWRKRVLKLADNGKSWKN